MAKGLGNLQISQAEKPDITKRPFSRLNHSSEQDMAPSKRIGRPIASRHFVCGTCSNWVEFESSGCTNYWTEMRGGTCVFACKGCREVARLVQREVEDLRQMMETMTRMVTGLGLAEKGGQTGDRVSRREEEC